MTTCSVRLEFGNFQAFSVVIKTIERMSESEISQDLSRVEEWGDYNWMPRACWTSKNNKLRTCVGLRCAKVLFFTYFLRKRVKREEAKVDIWKWILSNPLQLCVTASFAFDINIGTSILIFLFNFQCWVSFSSFFFWCFTRLLSWNGWNFVPYRWMD